MNKQHRDATLVRFNQLWQSTISKIYQRPQTNIQVGLLFWWISILHEFLKKAFICKNWRFSVEFRGNRIQQIRLNSFYIRKEIWWQSVKQKWNLDHRLGIPNNIYIKNLGDATAIFININITQYLWIKINVSKPWPSKFACWLPKDLIICDTGHNDSKFWIFPHTTLSKIYETVSSACFFIIIGQFSYKPQLAVPSLTLEYIVNSMSANSLEANQCLTSYIMKTIIKHSLLGPYESTWIINLWCFDACPRSRIVILNIIVNRLGQ